MLSGNPGQMFEDGSNKVYYSDGPQQERTRQKSFEWTKRQKRSLDDHLIITPNRSQIAHVGLQNALLSERNHSRGINNLNKDETNVDMLNHKNMGPSFYGAQDTSTNVQSCLDSTFQGTTTTKFTPRKKKIEGPDTGNNGVIKKGGVQAKLFSKSPNIHSTRFRNDKRSLEEPSNLTFSNQRQQQGYKMHHQNRDVFYDDPPKEHQMQNILTSPQPLSLNGFPIRFYIFFMSISTKANITTRKLDLKRFFIFSMQRKLYFFSFLYKFILGSIAY